MWIHYPLETRTELRSSRLVISACTSPFWCQIRRVTTGIYKNMWPDYVMFRKVTWSSDGENVMHGWPGRLLQQWAVSHLPPSMTNAWSSSQSHRGAFVEKLKKKHLAFQMPLGYVTTNYPLTDTQQWLQLSCIVMDWLLKVLLIDVID